MYNVHSFSKWNVKWVTVRFFAVVDYFQIVFGFLKVTKHDFPPNLGVGSNYPLLQSCQCAFTLTVDVSGIIFLIKMNMGRVRLKTSKKILFP